MDISIKMLKGIAFQTEVMVKFSWQFSRVVTLSTVFLETSNFNLIYKFIIEVGTSVWFLWADFAAQ